MPRFISDQNKVVLLIESGTYGVTSGNGIWVGEVTEHSIDDAENLLVDRYLGASTRSVSEWAPGPRDVTGTITYNAQDMRLPFWAIGSVNNAGTGSNNIHYVNQINTNANQTPFTSGTLNAPMSFGFEDSKNSGGTGSTFLRTVKGCCINTATITASQGEKVKVEIDYLAQNMFYSGGTSSLTPTGSNISTTPYLWSNCTFTLSGTTMNTAKEISLEINNNLTGPHYLNGSRDIAAPYPGNRDNTINLSYDLDEQTGTVIYDLYKRNVSFNCIFDMNADNQTTGSRHVIFFLSGCKVNKCEVPSVVEGTVEASAELVCPTIIGSAIDNIINYNPW